MTPSEMPNEVAMAASAKALRFFRSRTERVKPRPEIATMASAEVHSRSPVTAAGGTCANSRAASPAPNCTDTIPVRIMTAGSTAPPRSRSCPGSVRTVSLSPT